MGRKFCRVLRKRYSESKASKVPPISCENAANGDAVQELGDGQVMTEVGQEQMMTEAGNTHKLINLAMH